MSASGSELAGFARACAIAAGIREHVGTLGSYAVKALARSNSALDKLRLGVRVVGPAAALHGFWQLMTLAVTRPPTARVALRGGLHLDFDYPSQLAPSLVMFGDVIDPEFAMLSDLSPTDWTFIDVGAAIGQFSLFAGLMPQADVHAFEPSDANIRSLVHNIELNGLSERVHVHRIALSNHTGEAHFPTASRTYLSRLDFVGPATISNESVPVRRLDEQLSGLGIEHVNVMKVNVAGAEPEVLDGASGYLSSGRVDIVILLMGESSIPWYARLRAQNFRLGFYHPGNRTFHTVNIVDEGLFQAMPWPARHVLAVSEGAISRGVLDGIVIAAR